MLLGLGLRQHVATPKTLYPFHVDPSLKFPEIDEKIKRLHFWLWKKTFNHGKKQKQELLFSVV